MKKRLLSLLVTGVLMLGLMPNAYAAHTYYYKDTDGNTLTQNNFDPYSITYAAECCHIHGLSEAPEEFIYGRRRGILYDPLHQLAVPSEVASYLSAELIPCTESEQRIHDDFYDP